MQYLYQTEWKTDPPALELSSPPIDVNVRRRGFDPFFSGLAVGAVATVAGMVLGLYLFLPF